MLPETVDYQALIKTLDEAFIDGTTDQYAKQLKILKILFKGPHQLSKALHILQALGYYNDYEVLLLHIDGNLLEFRGHDCVN